MTNQQQENKENEIYSTFNRKSIDINRRKSNIVNSLNLNEDKIYESKLNDFLTLPSKINKKEVNKLVTSKDLIHYINTYETIHNIVIDQVIFYINSSIFILNQYINQRNLIEKDNKDTQIIIGMVGCGNIGQGILRKLQKMPFSKRILVSSRSFSIESSSILLNTKEEDSVEVVVDNEKVFEKASIIILSVQGHQFENIISNEVYHSLKTRINSRVQSPPIIVSTMIGISEKRIRSLFDEESLTVLKTYYNPKVGSDYKDLIGDVKDVKPIGSSQLSYENLNFRSDLREYMIENMGIFLKSIEIIMFNVMNIINLSMNKKGKTSKFYLNTVDSNKDYIMESMNIKVFDYVDSNEEADFFKYYMRLLEK